MERKRKLSSIRSASEFELFREINEGTLKLINIRHKLRANEFEISRENTTALDRRELKNLFWIMASSIEDTQLSQIHRSLLGHYLLIFQNFSYLFSGEKTQNCSKGTFETSSQPSPIRESNWKTQIRSYGYETQQSSAGAKGMYIRVRPRFFDQVGHQTTNASIGNKYFFTK